MVLRATQPARVHKGTLDEDIPGGVAVTITWRAENGLKWVESTALDHTGLVAHGFTSRVGGVSEAPFASLNLGDHVGDPPERVAENRHRILSALNLDTGAMVHGEQVHGDRVVRVTGEHVGSCAQGDLAATDGLCTDVPGLALVILTADCVPVLLLDPVHRAIGACHAGWKGTVAKIAQKTALTMAEEFGTRAADLLVAIGPSIGPCCYEVGESVTQAAHLSFGLWAYDTLIERDQRTHFDLWAANRLQLEEIGVPSEQIQLTGLCTSCHVDQFFSYRAEHGKTGRLAGVIALVR